MKPGRTTLLAVPLLALALALGSCGGGGEGNGGGNGGGGGDGDQVVAGEAAFKARCGSCHTLAAAGTSGTAGPDLDDLKPSAKRVLAAIENGGKNGTVMPKDLVAGKEAQQVADYVAQNAGQ